MGCIKQSPRKLATYWLRKTYLMLVACYVYWTEIALPSLVLITSLADPYSVILTSSWLLGLQGCSNGETATSCPFTCVHLAASLDLCHTACSPRFQDRELVARNRTSSNCLESTDRLTIATAAQAPACGFPRFSHQPLYWAQEVQEG